MQSKLSFDTATHCLSDPKAATGRMSYSSSDMNLGLSSAAKPVPKGHPWN